MKIHKLTLFFVLTTFCFTACSAQDRRIFHRKVVQDDITKGVDNIRQQERAMRIIVLRPPTVAREVQAELLSERYNVPYISMGKVLHSVVDSSRESGRNFDAIMKKGELVPDHVAIALLAQIVQQNKYSRGFVLDGFPRTVTQAKALDRMIKILPRGYTVVVNVEADDQAILGQARHRALCTRCNTAKLEIFRDEKECDVCQGDETATANDEEEVILHKLHVYREQIAPIISYYLPRKEFVTVSIDKSTLETFDNIVSNIELQRQILVKK
ncbi:Adenylate kinase (modular protein) [Alphaproteobacteria bacterium]